MAHFMVQGSDQIYAVAVGRGDGMSGMLKFILPIRIWAGGFML